MVDVRLESAVGVVNGVNVTFNTVLPYLSSSLEVFVNGMLRRNQDQDGWVETGANEFQLKEAPQVGDRVTVFYKV